MAKAHTDAVGTPQLTTNNAATINWSALYEPFGRASNVTSSGVTQNLRLPGQYEDAESGFHYNYFRDYNPDWGRYLQADPIGLEGGMNTYAYVSNNPRKFTDRLGLESGLLLSYGNNVPSFTGTITAGQTTTEIIAYRYYGGTSGQLGGWLSPQLYPNSTAAIDVPCNDEVGVHVWDFASRRKDMMVPISQLNETLEETVSLIKSWL